MGQRARVFSTLVDFDKIENGAMAFFDTKNDCELRFNRAFCIPKINQGIPNETVIRVRPFLLNKWDF